MDACRLWGAILWLLLGTTTITSTLQDKQVSLFLAVERGDNIVRRNTVSIKVSCSRLTARLLFLHSEREGARASISACCYSLLCEIRPEIENKSYYELTSCEMSYIGFSMFCLKDDICPKSIQQFQFSRPPNDFILAKATDTSDSHVYERNRRIMNERHLD